MEKLTVAEAQITERLAYGETAAEIAAHRGTSVNTVKGQIVSAKKRVQARTRSQLVAIYLVMPSVRP